MSMVIKNNKEAINALNTLNQNADALTKSLQKVSTGMKINGAADDASGYAISERMRVQLRSLEADISNTQNATSLLKTPPVSLKRQKELYRLLLIYSKLLRKKPLTRLMTPIRTRTALLSKKNLTNTCRRLKITLR